MSIHWRLASSLTYPLAKLLVGLRVRGRENLGRGPLILAANHVSNFDPLIMGWAAGREVHFLAKEELFKGPRLFAWLIRHLNAHPLRRGAADIGALKVCSELLRSGQTLVLFPEGTRSPTGVPARFKPGLGMLAIGSGAPVVPTLIHGMDKSIVSYWVDRDFVRRGKRRKPAGPVSVTVLFGEPVLPDRFGRGRAAYEHMAAAVEQNVQEMARCLA